MSEDHTHQPLCIPVRDNRCGFTLRLFRDRDGSRCAVAFTTPERMTAVLGAAQRWLPLAEDAVRELLRPLAVQRLIVDPNLVAPPVHPDPRLSTQPIPELPMQLPLALAGNAGGPTSPQQ